MTTARTMTERELGEAAAEIACELLLIAFAIHGRTRPALAAVYAAVACSDAFERSTGTFRPAGTCHGGEELTMAETRESPDREPLWNVVVPVIALLRAPDGQAAQARLAKALEMAGFDLYEDSSDPVFTAPFESESGPVEDVLPEEGSWPWGR